MTSLTDIVVINRALARIGSKPIFALDEETQLAALAVSAYEDRRDQLLGLHPWHFAKRTARLTAVAETADNGWSSTNQWGNGYRYAFALPGDRLDTPRKLLTDPRRPDSPLRAFLVEQGRVFADRDTLWATFTVRAAPALWSPAFRLALIVLLASDLAVPVSHDAKMAAELLAQGEGAPDAGGRGGLVGKAIAADVSGSPASAPLLVSDDLTTAHLT